SAQTLGLDPDRLHRHLARVATKRNGTLRNKDTGRRLAAIMPVHVFGHVGDMAGLRRVAENWNLAILEDATEALGSRTDDGMLFRFGVAAMLSFNGNKVVTTGGGGAVLTDDSEFARR